MGYKYIIKFRERVPGTEGATGRIIMPSGIQAITLDRRRMPSAVRGQGTIFAELDDAHEWLHEPGLLLDPQLYLGGLSPETCADACSNLVGFPWFKRQTLEQYDSGRFTQNEYRNQIRSKVTELWQGVPENDVEIGDAIEQSIQYQMAIGCSAIILPSPLTIDPGTSYQAELQWLDEGLRRARLSAPKLHTMATVALSDICTFSAEPQSNRLLETIVDHVTAREPDGVYIVIEQRIDQAYYISSPQTFRTILRLVSEIADAGIDNVLVAWAGLAGFVSLAAGGHGWASGWYRKERRLKLDDHRDEAGGKAAAAYYSHRLCGELHPADLDRVHEAGLLHLVEEDTPWSQDLFRALRAGIKTADVPTWTNDAARGHFNAVVIRETNRLLGLSQGQRVKQIREWLNGATARAKRISALGSVHDRTALGHQSTWQKAFDVWATPTKDDNSRTHSGE